MKRLISIVLVVMAIFVGIAITTPFFIKSDVIRTKITQHFQDITGSQVTFQGNPSLSINPFLGVELSNLEILDTSTLSQPAALLSTEKVSVKLELFSLLQGKLEISEYKFLRPKLSLTIDPNGTKNWAFKSGRLKQALDAVANNDEINSNTPVPQIQLGNITVVDGIIEFNNMVEGTSEVVSSFNGTLDWADTSNNASFAGNGIWRGEGMTAAANIASPLQLLSGKESTLTLEINSQPLAIRFDGLANTQADLFVKGQLQANTPSINRLASLFKFNNEQSKIIESWRVSGVLEATASNISLANASVAIGEDEAKGVLRLSKNDLEKYKLDGTLAFDTIDLMQLITAETNIANTGLSIFPLKDVGVDLRVSSPAITFGDLSFEAVAASLLIDEKSWTLDIGNANAFEGTLLAKFGERLNEDKRQAYIDLSTTNVNLATISQLLGNQTISVSGQSSFNLNVRTNTLPNGIFSSGLNGALEGTVTQGQLRGVDLLALLALENGTPTISEETYSQNAVTGFDTLNFKIFLNNGIAAVSKTEIITEENLIQIIGDVNLIEGELDLQVQEKTEVGPAAKRLYINGKLEAPNISLKQIPSLNN